MKLNIPKRKGSDGETYIEVGQSLVIFGANGSGKTRFGSRIERGYESETHRISAQKSLSIPRSIATTSLDRAQSEFYYGIYYDNIDKQESPKFKWSNRWGSNYNTHLLDDFEKLLVLLHTEEYQNAITTKNSTEKGKKTKLDIICDVWEELLPHRKIRIGAGIIEVYPSGNPDLIYNGADMSDGERVIFYLIGQAVCAKPNSILVIDEPEMHLHRSLINVLWNKIEIVRSDCTFIYLTHDIEFCLSRRQAKMIWIKGYEQLSDEETWNYEILETGNDIPEEVYFAILGSRKPVLFIEGAATSIDRKLYQRIFPEFTIASLGSCDLVFESTKAFNNLRDFHHLNANGIIDRDYRDDADVQGIREKGVWVTDVAESENLLMLEDVVKAVARSMRLNPDDVFTGIKDKVLKEFLENFEVHVTKHAIARIKRLMNLTLNPKVNNFIDLNTYMSDFIREASLEDIYFSIETDFENYLRDEDYSKILKVINQKGLLYKADVPGSCGLSSKSGSFLEYVCRILDEKSEESMLIRSTIRLAIH